MGMNQTPVSERIHIGFFRKRNAGKSSLLNAITGQNLSIVSQIKGTTTDPVYKTMELFPLGPVLFIDTPGIDDEGPLGTLRVQKSHQILNKTDIAVLVIDETIGITSADEKFLMLIQKKQIPCLLVHNKLDLAENIEKKSAISFRFSGKFQEIWVSASENLHISTLKKLLTSMKTEEAHKSPLISDLISPQDLVILVISIDQAAPKKRLIFPQQQTIREILDCGGIALTVRDTELKQTLEQFCTHGIRPKLIVTDSQIFSETAKTVPTNLMLTSFSILFARYKGNLTSYVQGIDALSQIEDGDNILIAEGCTHHRQCCDIGTVKIPAWIQGKTGQNPIFTFTCGGEFPECLTSYKMVIHCGGCMLSQKEMHDRISRCCEQNIPITNYGILIAQITGILKRSLEPFPEIAPFAALPKNTI